MNIDDEVVRKSLEEARATVARTKYLNPEPPLVVYENARRRAEPEPEPEPHQYKLDTNITAAVEARCAYLETKLAECLPAILTFMENTAKEWNAMKARTEKTEKQVEEVSKRLADMHQRINLDIKAMELGLRGDILDVREHKANVNGK